MANVDALFDSGSEDEEDFVPRARVAVPASPTGSADLAQDRAPATGARLMRDDEEDEEEQHTQRPAPRQLGPPITLEGPLLDVGCDTQKLRMVKLSNILGIDIRPFNPDTFQMEEAVYVDEEGKQRVRLQDQNTIRWRNTVLPDGTIGPESNARFVRWSDGSLQLLLGEEVLDVADHDMNADNSYVYARHPNVMQGQGALMKKFAFRPASLNSKFHKRLTAKIDVRYTKTNKVKTTFTVADPSREKHLKEKAEEERIRSKEMLERRQEASMRKYGSAVRRPRVGARAAGITAEYLEAGDDEADYEDDEEEGLTATERARQSLMRNRRTDEQAEREAERRLAEAKRQPPPRMAGPSRGPKRRRDSSESEEPEVSDDDDEEVGGDSEEEAPRKKPPAKRHALVLSDDDSD